MAAKVRPIPEGYHTITPYLIIRNASEAIDFYKKAFNATELYRMSMPDGRVGHAEIQIGNSRIMLADEIPNMEARSPQHFGGTPISMLVYVEDVDQIATQATNAGMKVKRPVQDQFYGDRCGTFEDPFGHIWSIATHKEDLSSDEINRRAKAAFAEGGCG